MQVSAVNTQNNGYNLTNCMFIYNNRYSDQIADTSFNSLTPYTSSKRIASEKKLPYVFDSINQWKNFCNHRVLGKKLNIIA